MLISVDHGNKLIKTSCHTFTSGLYESSSRPAFGDDILYYSSPDSSETFWVSADTKSKTVFRPPKPAAAARCGNSAADQYHGGR